jgi:hypothetical protein
MKEKSKKSKKAQKARKTRADERRWMAAFQKSQDKLAKLADEALDEFERGETEPLSNLETRN